MFIKKDILEETLNGKLEDRNTHLRAIISTFPLIIERDGSNYRLTINATSEEDKDNEQFGQFIADLKSENAAILAITRYSYSLVLTLRVRKAREFAETVNGVVNPILSYLRGHYYQGCCEETGYTDRQLDCYEINRRYHYLSEEGADAIYASLQSRQTEIRSEKSQFLPGIVGAFLGSLIGAVLWILIYRLGFISAITGIVMGVCTMKGYELLGKHLDKKGVIACIIIMIVMVYLSNRLAWAWDAYDALKQYEWSFSECFRELNYILETLELKGSFIADLVMGYLLTFVGSFSTMYNALKASTGSFTFRK